MRHRSRHCRSAAVLLGAASLLPAMAMAAVIESVLVSRTDERAEIAIRFACSHRPVVAAPAAAATSLELPLERTDGCVAGRSAINEAVQPPGRALAHLVELEYAMARGGEAVLRLRFDLPVQVTVVPGGDPRSVRVSVAPVPGLAAAAEPERRQVPAVRPPPGPRTLTAEQRDRAAARARSLAAPAPAAADPRYTINLQSSVDPIDMAGARAALGRRPGQLYVSDTRSGDQVWHRLRLGFFSTEAEAGAVLDGLRDRYPDGWVTLASAAERAAAGADAAPVAAIAATATGSAGAGLTNDQVSALLADARAAVIERDFPRVIQLTTRVLAEPDQPGTADARELLGLARERNGQVAHAVAEYRRYLADYPDGEGAARVAQRLAALTTAREQPRAAARAPARRQSAWDAYGGIGQYYRHDSLDFGSGAIDQSGLYSDGEVVVRRAGEWLDFGSRVTLSHVLDLSGGDRGPGDQVRFYNAYVDFADRAHGLSSRVGRQTLRNQGVLGRFDGLLLSWQRDPSWRLNVLGGFPVYTSADGIDSGRQFYGLSVDLLQLIDAVDVNLFVNSQDVDGLSARQAVGGELRYFGDRGSLVTAVDFDVGYSEMNSLVVLGNWTFPGALTVNASLDWRKTPVLTTENALIGQPVDSLEQLLRDLTEDEIRRLAADRTGSMQTASAGIAKALSPRFQVSADVTLSEFEGTPASGGVPATPDSGLQTWYYASLIGTSLLKEGDTSVLGLRYADATNARAWSIFVDSRYPLTRQLRLNPRLLFSQRDLVTSGATERFVRPSLRLFYRLARRWQLELDAGGEFGSYGAGDAASDGRSWYVFMGYRADF